MPFRHSAIPSNRVTPPYPSTSLFLATGLRRCLVSFHMLPVTYISRWRHESMRSFNKLSADTVLCARNKNMRFLRHVGSFVKMSSSAVELQLAPSSCKSKVWKDFGFKVFYDGQGVRHFSLYSCVICYHLLAGPHQWCLCESSNTHL